MLITTKTGAKTTTDEKHALSSIITLPITKRFIWLFIWQYYLLWEFDFVEYFGAFQREIKVTISLTFATEQSFEYLEIPEH